MSKVLEMDLLTPNTNEYFYVLTSAGQLDSIRRYGTGTIREGYNSRGYTEAIADFMSTDEQLIRRLMRTLRATSVLESTKTPQYEDTLALSLSKLRRFNRSLPASLHREEEIISKQIGQEQYKVVTN